MKKIFKHTTPYPFIDGEEFIDGIKIEQPELCRSCKRKNCLDGFNKVQGTDFYHFSCGFGVSCLRIIQDGVEFKFNGILVEDLNNQCPPKNQVKLKRIHSTEIKHWLSTRVPEILSTLDQEIEEVKKEHKNSRHDLKSSLGVVVVNMDSILNDYSGSSEYDKSRNMPPNIQKLYRSIKLHQSCFQLSSLISNPSSAKNGRPIPQPVYRYFDRFKWIFEELAQETGHQIRIEGPSTHQAKLYNSFELVPQVLLDNAIKYGSPHSNIKIKITDLPDGGTSVVVKSYGDHIPVGLRKKIFDKEVRANGDSQIEGSGLGLYIAKVICEANGIALVYHPEQEGKSTVNTFSLIFPAVG